MTAEDPGDFTGVTPVGCPTGQTVFSFSIPITSDQVVEDIESAFLSLGTVTLPGSFTRSNPITLASATETLQINDDDSSKLLNLNFVKSTSTRNFLRQDGYKD